MASDDALRRPSPVVTDDSAVFWDAAAQGRLVAERCGSCARLRHPPRPMCPYCQSLEVEVEELSGRGQVYSYGILHHPKSPAFDYPVIGVLVDLEEGVRIVSNLTDVAPDGVRIGLAVEVHYVSTVGGPTVPVFRPRPEVRS